MEHVWGFDIGTTSIGFSVVNLDEEKGEGTIIREGVRIFPEGRTEDKLEPRNQARRAARLLRRQVRRRRLRRKFLREAFAGAGLLPQFGSPEWDEFINPRHEVLERSPDKRLDPYALRARGLREPLEPFEIGRALYHLCHRRGFLSARRIEERPQEKKAREKEEGPVKEEIKGWEQKLRGKHGRNSLSAAARTRPPASAGTISAVSGFWRNLVGYGMSRQNSIRNC